MSVIAQIAVFFVALIHVGILALEMFLWDKPIGMRVFKTDLDFAKKSKKLAQNIGLYNGFLAAGLLWSLMPLGFAGGEKAIATFFLGCVIVAGIFGAATVNKRILFEQGLPAVFALGLVWLL